MRINHVRIENFRNIRWLDTHLDEGINIIYGNNAQGKTNLLEAIHFSAAGYSARAANDRELVRFGEEYAHVRTVIQDRRESSAVTLDSHIQINGVKTQKSLSVDRTIKKINEFIGRLPAVFFSPEDLRLIKAGPAERRAFMDTEICQFSPVYFNDLKEYNRALRQRNHLLKSLQKNRSGQDSLFIWDEQLTRSGVRIMRTRSRFIEKLGPLAREIHRQTSGYTEILTVEYIPNIKDQDPEGYARSLKKDYARDTALGSTQSGVHKDDLLFMINDVPARAYGSQGQQRTAALSAKLAEIEIIRESAGTGPVLLLDDVLSELDERRQRFLLSQIGDMQTVLTCTGVEDLIRKNASLAEYRIMKMENGNIV